MPGLPSPPLPPAVRPPAPPDPPDPPVPEASPRFWPRPPAPPVPPVAPETDPPGAAADAAISPANGAVAACPGVSADGCAGNVSAAGGLHPGHTGGRVAGVAAVGRVTTAVAAVGSGAAVAAGAADGGAASGGVVADAAGVLGLVAEEKLRKRSSGRCQANISLDYATMGGDGRVVPAAAGPGPCHHQGSVGVIVKGLNVSGHDNSTDAEMRRRPGMRPLLESGLVTACLSGHVSRGQ